jgi:hypothetical protein
VTETGADPLEGIRDRSIRVPLDIPLGSPVRLVWPKGASQADALSLLSRFGPLSSMVLTSLRDVGVRARTDELQELWDLVLRDAFPDADAKAPGGEPVATARTAVLYWRLVALFAQLAEELAALCAAIETWTLADRGRFEDCQIGKDYLLWRLPPRASLNGVLRRFADANAMASLIHYPTATDLAPFFLTAKQARILDRLGQRSSQTAASLCQLAAELMTDDVQRTFVRWKHRVTATSPNVVPLWLPADVDEVGDAVQHRFDHGFGIIDWAPQPSARPQLILWPAERIDFAAYQGASSGILQLMILLLDAALRHGLGTVTCFPYITLPAAPLSSAERRAIDALEASDYRLQVLVAGVRPQGRRRGVRRATF